MVSLKPGDAVLTPPTPPPEVEVMRSWKDISLRPVVTVVCHTYNHSAFIKDALNGFLIQQTTFPFEVVIHDDASTDGTRGIIESYQERYPQIIKPIFQQENIYAKGERPLRYSFPASRGKYIAFCEGDDYWVDRHKLQIQASFLENNQEYALCYTRSTPFSNGLVIADDFGGAQCDLSDIELKMGPAISTLTTCFRNVLDNPPELNLIRYGDKFIWSRLGKFGKGKFLNNIDPSFYRVHAGGIHSSSSKATRRLMYIQTYAAISAYYNRVGDHDLSCHFLEKLKREIYRSDGVTPRLISSISPILYWLRIFKKSLV